MVFSRTVFRFSIPTATAGLTYYFWPRTAAADCTVIDPNAAVELLNANRGLPKVIRCLEALDHLRVTECRNLVDNLNSVGWCRLAMEGSELCDLHRYKHSHTTAEKDDEEIDHLLHQARLDSNWKGALYWYSVNVCNEEDLSCQDAPIVQKRSKTKKLAKLLKVLLYKSEFDSCKELIEQNIPHILYIIFCRYHEAHKQIGVDILKILSNIAEDSSFSAEHIVRSEWIPLLARLIKHPIHQEEAIISHKICANLLYSLGAEKHRLPPNIYELHRPPQGVEPVMDIVFLHGMRGNAFRTWRQKDSVRHKTTQFWPKDFLAKDIHTPVRIMAIDYASSFLQFGSVMKSVSERSHKFQNVFRQAGVGERPVLFICHSMGGLLAKQMLLDNKELRSKTLGVLFMATPHRGSAVASAYAYSLLRPTDDLRLLSVESAINKKLHQDFCEIVPEIPIFVTMLETRETKLLGTRRMIVPPESGAFLGTGNIQHVGSLYHIDEHHHNICKPFSPQAPAYKVVLNFINDALRIANNST